TKLGALPARCRQDSAQIALSLTSTSNSSRSVLVGLYVSPNVSARPSYRAMWEELESEIRHG
ncbi:MAG: hypothetical protein ACRDTD_29625, partial [Pseudonocardiaceae bacterium]